MQLCKKHLLLLLLLSPSCHKRMSRYLLNMITFSVISLSSVKLLFEALENHHRKIVYTILNVERRINEPRDGILQKDLYRVSK